VISTPDDERLSPNERSELIDYGLVSELLIPLAAGDRLIGCIDIFDDRPRNWAEVLDLIEAVGQMVAGGLDGILLAEQLRQRSEDQAALLSSQREHGARLQSLLESSRAVATGDLAEALAIVARVTGEALGVSECLVFEYDPEAESITPRAYYEEAPCDWNGLGLPLALADCPAERELLAHGGVLEEHRSDPDLDPSSRQVMERWGEHTCLTVPICFGRSHTGLFALYQRERERHFSEEEIALVRGLGEQAAMAIHSHQLLRRVEERNRRLASLVQAGACMSADRPLEEVLPEVARQAVHALACDYCLISEYVEQDDLYVEKAYYAADPNDRYEMASWVLGDDDWKLRELLSRGASVEEQLSDADLSESVRRSMVRWGEKTCLTVPLIFRASPLGVLVLGVTTCERSFTEEERSYVAALGRQAAAALHHERQLAKLEQSNGVLKTLVDTDRAITSTLLLPEVLRILVSEAAQVLRSSSCLVWEYIEERGVLVEREHYDVMGGHGAGAVERTLAERPDVALVLFADGPVVETSSDACLDGASRASLQGCDVATRLSVPIRFGDERLGLLVFSEQRAERAFTASELDLAAGLADRAAIAMHNARQYEEVERRNQELADRVRREQFLREVSADLASSLDLEAVLAAAARRFASYFGVAACDIYAADAGALTCIASMVDGECCDSAIGTRLGTEDASLAHLALESATSMTAASLEDCRLTTRERRLMREWQLNSILSVPIIAKDRVLGVVDLLDRHERVFTDEERSTAEAVCAVAGLALDNATQFHRLRRMNREAAQHAQREALVNEVSLELTSSLDVHEICRTAAVRLTGALDVDSCEVCRLQNDRLICEVSIVDGQLSVSRAGTPSELSDSMPTRCAVESQTPQQVTAADSRLSARDRERMSSRGQQAVLVLPMTAAGRVLGTIELGQARGARCFSEEELATAQAVSRMTALAVENAGLFEAKAESAKRFASLVDAGHSIASPIVTVDVLATIAQKAAEALGSPECVIFELDQDALTLTAKAVSQEDPEGSPDLGKPMSLADLPTEQAVIEGRQIDVDAAPISEGASVGTGTGARPDRVYVRAPLYFAEEPLGLLALRKPDDDRQFADDDLVVLSGLSTQAAIALHHARLFERLELRTYETEVLNEIARAAASSLRLAGIAEATVTHLGQLIRFDSSSLVCELTDGVLEVAYSTGGQSALEGMSLHEVDEPFIRKLSRERVAIVDTPDGLPLPPEHPTRAGLGSAAVVGLFDEGELIGALTLGASSSRSFASADRRILEAVGTHLSLALKNIRLYENAKHLHLGNLKSLSSALLAKDYYTIGHTARVATYAVLLATELEWSRPAVEEIEEVAYLHDVGKIAVSDHVLLKAGALNEEEWHLMRQHPVISAEIIEPLLDAELVAGVRHHHERYDGTGYPDGLRGEDIPKMARLMAVVDAYDAMSSRRVYRSPLDYQQCLDELERCRGTQFDPTMLDAFRRVLRRMERKKEIAEAAAAEAAQLIDAGDHARLKGEADMETPEYERVLASVRTAQATHAPVRFIATQACWDDLRVMMVADSDESPATHVPVGQLFFADHAELQELRGQTVDANVVRVNHRGSWVTGLAPIRDDDGGVIAVVSADVPATSASRASLGPSRVSETFASIASCAAERLTRAEVDAMSDPLTGLPNHRYFHQRLEEEVKAARANGARLSLLFCDVDDFKTLNDTFGHAAGDQALRDVARVIKACLRGPDVAARYGGDEFCAILCGVDEHEARDVAERIRARVARGGLHPGGGRMGLSIGIATTPSDGVTKEELLKAADANMYKAKRRREELRAVVTGQIAGVPNRDRAPNSR
jgi:diguanylate cyclase (GGDEF)-like protein